jgi:opacity protein-like surface antigen
MKRLLRILAAAALAVVLMATSVSPAFADPPEQWGLKKDEGETGIGHGTQKDEGETGIGFKCGQEDQDPPRSECD